jgi:hypothetical protein
MKIIKALLKLILFTFIATILLVPKMVIYFIKLNITINSIILDTIKFLVDRVEGELKPK